MSDLRANKMLGDPQANKVLDDPPLTQYGKDIPRLDRRGNDLRDGIVTPDQAEQTDQLVNLNKPHPPLIIRRPGRVLPIW